jgi:hypothetical protein
MLVVFGFAIDPRDFDEHINGHRSPPVCCVGCFPIRLC